MRSKVAAQLKARDLLLALSTAGFLLIFLLVARGYGAETDTEVFRSLNEFSSNTAVASLSLVVTQFGGELILALIGVAYYVLDRRENAELLVGILFVIVLSDFVLFIIKGAYFRPRPYQTLANVILPIGPDEGSSFPSGHVTRGFAVVTMILLLKGRNQSPLLVVSTAVAVSRVLIGVHFPSDVLAGSLLGVVLALVSVKLLSRYIFPRIPQSFGASSPAR